MSFCTKGQTLIEFVIFSVISSLTVILAVKLLQSEWQRSQCAYLVFESTYFRLIGRPNLKSRIPVSITEFSNSVRGVGYCGNMKEEVELPLLESAQW